jgi:hypothetical protein
MSSQQPQPSMTSASSSRPSSLGRLVPVPVREAWAHEAIDFTPWLAAKENLDVLSAALGLNLEMQSREVSVGPFHADLLCKDVGTNDLVLVENQFAGTDHGHLGQILTYAAGLDAKTVVWIAETFNERHRAALDWLNAVTRDDVQFFGVEIRLLRIGDSAPAPQFHVVVHPNEWVRERRGEAEAAARDPSSTESVRAAFWRSFGEYLQRTHSVRGRPTPKGHSFWDWGIGRSQFGLIASLQVRDSRVSVYLVLHGPEAKSRFRALARSREAIERELGLAPSWNEKPDRIESQVRVERECDFEQSATWEPVHKWLGETLDRFDRVFRPRVSALPSGESE